MGKKKKHLHGHAVRLAFPKLDQRVVGSNPTGGEILYGPKQHLFAQISSWSLFHHPDTSNND